MIRWNSSSHAGYAGGARAGLGGSVTQIPASNDSFDVSLCCQVLEHLPFEQFIPALKELRPVTRNVLVMSLPDQSPYFYVKFLLPKSIGFNWEFSRPKLRLPVLSREGSGQCGHFWEIGCKGTTLRNVCDAIISSHWQIVRTWRVPETVRRRGIVPCAILAVFSPISYLLTSISFHLR